MDRWTTLTGPEVLDRCPDSATLRGPTVAKVTVAGRPLAGRIALLPALVSTDDGASALDAAVHGSIRVL
jgi:hypothetical protein